MQAAPGAPPAGFHAAFLRGGTMTFWQWLAAISQSTAPAGQPFAPHWSYVALAVGLPVAFGLLSPVGAGWLTLGLVALWLAIAAA